MASDSDFFAVRRFDRLHTRAILTLQAQLVDIEERLDKMDEKFSLRHVMLVGARPPRIVDTSLEECKSPDIEDDLGGKNLPRHINNGTVKDDLEERARLVAEMTAKLGEYGKSRIFLNSGYTLWRTIKLTSYNRQAHVEVLIVEITRSGTSKEHHQPRGVVQEQS
jgi:hypothetical protein